MIKQAQKITIKDAILSIQEKKSYLIGVSGIPGAGKSTISELLKSALTDSIVVPMDGFHLYRKDLDQQGLKKRGAPFTFNFEKFRAKLIQLKQPERLPVKFPSFDHEFKDPNQNAIQITKNIKHVIIEGLYIFDKSLKLEEQNFWDLKLFIDEGKDVCLPRLIKRCLEKKIEDTEQKAVERATKSDLVNGDYVLHHSCWQNVLLIKNPNKLIITSQQKS